MADRLWVYVSDERAGHLDNDQNSFRFQYDLGARTPVSVRLPIREEPYGDSQCRPFFTNLLPEGDWRLALSRNPRTVRPPQYRVQEARRFQDNPMHNSPNRKFRRCVPGTPSARRKTDAPSG